MEASLFCSPKPPSPQRQFSSQARIMPTLRYVDHKRYDIPYFGHEELDPNRYLYGCGTVLRDLNQEFPSPAEGDSDWEDEEQSVEGDSEDEYMLQAPKAPKRKRSSGAINASSYKKLKVAGGRPAIAKKVTADLDSDDDLLVRMKNAKYLEKDIAQRLKDEGRINYNPKTIGTRWNRLKKVLQKQNDDMLDAELTDWHEGDDDVLFAALKKAEAEVKKAVEEAQAKKWRIVADEMKIMKPVTNFSQNACRNRYEALWNRTARAPPELRTNQTEQTKASIQRRRERQAKIEADRLAGLAGEPKSFEVENIENNAWSSRAKKY